MVYSNWGSYSREWSTVGRIVLILAAGGLLITLMGFMPRRPGNPYDPIGERDIGSI